MFILESGCGWIPEAPIKFMSHIIDIIKVLTPVYLVIMGSIGFGKAIISQKEDEIKKAQASFIKKIIAGAAVFFVIIFAEWITNLITKVGGDASGAMSCVNALLNGTYSSDDKDYYEQPETTTAKSTNNSNNLEYDNSYKCEKILTLDQYSDLANTPDSVSYDCWKSKRVNYNEFSHQRFDGEKAMSECYSSYVDQYYGQCLKEQNKNFADCKIDAKCNSIYDCPSCATVNEIEYYKYYKNEAIKYCNENSTDANDRENCIKNYVKPYQTDLVIYYCDKHPGEC